MIGRRELPELRDNGGDDLHSKINVGLRSMAAEAEAQAGARFLGRQSDGREDVRRLDGARGTSRARRTGKAPQVQGDEQRFAFDAGKNQIGSVWSAHRVATIDARMRYPTQKTVLELIAERGQALGVVRERVASDLGGFAEAHDAGDILRAGTNSALVVAAVKQLLQASPAANVERTNALGGIQFMPGKRKQIKLEPLDVDGSFSRGLHGIGVEINVGLFGGASDFLEWLNGAQFVVGVHDGDQHGLFAKGRSQIFEAD